ncbi:hypothetical protein LZ32DRAFT_183793 [Colletotrichum eremochloae]|nr:hypothetical protein LZ32DRAFT_183793 [Colletotrichum eremochloae]
MFANLKWQEQPATADDTTCFLPPAGRRMMTSQPHPILPEDGVNGYAEIPIEPLVEKCPPLVNGRILVRNGIDKPTDYCPGVAYWMDCYYPSCVKGCKQKQEKILGRCLKQKWAPNQVWEKQLFMEFIREKCELKSFRNAPNKKRIWVLDREEFDSDGRRFANEAVIVWKRVPGSSRNGKFWEGDKPAYLISCHQRTLYLQDDSTAWHLRKGERFPMLEVPIWNDSDLEGYFVDPDIRVEFLHELES